MEGLSVCTLMLLSELPEPTHVPLQASEPARRHM